MAPSQGSTVVVLAGRRIDAPDAPRPRFPLSHVARVRERLRTLFVEREASVLFCSAACGADLIALEVAGELGMQRCIVLPFEAEHFRDTSVTDRPGDWGPRFDRLLEQVGPRGILTLSPEEDGASAYEAANLVLLDEARACAVAEGTRPLAVLVWEGRSRGGVDHSASFLEAARARHFELAELSTAD